MWGIHRELCKLMKCFDKALNLLERCSVILSVNYYEVITFITVITVIRVWSVTVRLCLCEIVLNSFPSNLSYRRSKFTDYCRNKFTLVRPVIDEYKISEVTIMMHCKSSTF